MTRSRPFARARFHVLVAPFVVSSACGTFDPAVPMSLPDDDYAVGISTGLAWDEAADVLAFGASRGSQGVVGLDVGYLDSVFGLHGGLSLHGELATERLSVRFEATAWYGLLFGLGTRVGWLVGDPTPYELSAPSRIPEPAATSVDLTALVALPIPLWSDCEGRAGALVIAPYARPGLRLSGAADGTHHEDTIRGFHEVGLMLRWSSFAF